jgi:DNA-binding phage protein
MVVKRNAPAETITKAVADLAERAGISVQTLERYIRPAAKPTKRKYTKHQPREPQQQKQAKQSHESDTVQTYFAALEAFSEAVRNATTAAREGQLDNEAHRIAEAHRPVLAAMFDLEVALGLQVPRPTGSPGRH